MDFGLSEEQEMLQETIRGFAQNECPTTRLRELFDEGEGHDPALWSALAEMGVAGLIVPEEHGGAGMEILDLALVDVVDDRPDQFAIGADLRCRAAQHQDRSDHVAQRADRLPAA